MLDGPNGILDVADELAAIARLQLADLSLVVEDWVLEDLLYILVADLGRVLARRA